MPHHEPRIACGVAGWSYPDWRDTVYRLDAAPPQPDLFGVRPATVATYAPDDLAFLSRYVDMVEINSSFYRIPRPDVTATWAQRVADQPNFFFTAKLNQGFTHQGRRDLRLASDFRAAMEPLRSAGVLRGILAQFRYDVADTPKARTHIRWIADQFHDLARVIVEVRHHSWEQDSAVQFLRDLELTIANLDYPTARDSFAADRCLAGDTAYFRLHGRNRQAWFASNTAPHEPYNYDYSDTEIDELATQSQHLLADAKQLVIVANNHYQGKAVSAALRLKAQLQKQRVPVPHALLDTYPHLQRIAVDL